MVERPTTVDAVTTKCLWGVVALLVAASWVSTLLGHDPFARQFGFTACATSALAAVLQIRRWFVRVNELIRHMHSAEHSSAAVGVRSLR